MLFCPIFDMALDSYQKRELNNILKNPKFWVVPVNPSMAYPRYSDIASKIGCYVEDIKEYKDMNFPVGPTKKRKSSFVLKHLGLCFD